MVSSSCLKFIVGGGAALAGVTVVVVVKAAPAAEEAVTVVAVDKLTDVVVPKLPKVPPDGANGMVVDSSEGPLVVAAIFKLDPWVGNPVLEVVTEVVELGKENPEEITEETLVGAVVVSDGTFAWST